MLRDVIGVTLDAIGQGTGIIGQESFHSSCKDCEEYDHYECCPAKLFVGLGMDVDFLCNGAVSQVNYNNV